MKIVLARLPAYDTANPPLNLAYLSACLKKNKYRVKSFDLNIESYNKASQQNRDKFWRLGSYLLWNKKEEVRKVISEKDFEAWQERLLAGKPEVVGFSIYTTNMLASMKLAAGLKDKEPALKIVFGGPFCRRENGVAFSLIKRDYCDAVVVGEGESAFLELLASLSKGKFGRSPGSVIKRNGVVVDCGIRKPIDDLDRLPYPDFSDFDFTAYSGGSIPILTSRGCPNACAFCNDRSFWQKFRSRTADNVIGEIREQIEKYGIRRFMLCDLLVNGNKKLLEELCFKLIGLQNKLDRRISWSGYASLNGMDSNMVALMRNSGCEFLFFGLESGSAKSLRSVRKATDLKKAEEIIKLCASKGIGVNVGWMIGFPGETERDFRESFAYSKRIRPYLAGFTPANLLSVLPGSELREKPGKFGIRSVHPEDWTIWDDGLNSHEEKIKRLNFFNKQR